MDDENHSEGLEKAGNRKKTRLSTCLIGGIWWCRDQWWKGDITYTTPPKTRIYLSLKNTWYKHHNAICIEVCSSATGVAVSYTVNPHGEIEHNGPSYFISFSDYPPGKDMNHRIDMVVQEVMKESLEEYSRIDKLGGGEIE